jgi:integrase
MGVRPMELQNVGKPGTSIDWGKGLIIGIGVKTKTGRNREVVIPEEVMDIAKAFLFPVNQFAAVSRTCWQNRLDKLLDHMDMPRRTVGAGKSTYMTCLYSNGVKERDAQKLVGHVVGSSTLATNYLKLDNEALKVEGDRVITFGQKPENKTDSLEIIVKMAREKLGEEKLRKILLAQL